MLGAPLERGVRRAMRLGAKDYLTKPCSQTQLLTRMARLLRPAIQIPPHGIVDQRGRIV